LIFRIHTLLRLKTAQKNGKRRFTFGVLWELDFQYTVLKHTIYQNLLQAHAYHEIEVMEHTFQSIKYKPDTADRRYNSINGLYHENNILLTEISLVCI